MHIICGRKKLNQNQRIYAARRYAIAVYAVALTFILLHGTPDWYCTEFPLPARRIPRVNASPLPCKKINYNLTALPEKVGVIFRP